MSYLPNTFGQWSISNLRLEFPGSWAGGKNIEWRRMVYLLRDFSITDTSGVLTVREENNEMGKRKRKISVCWNSGTGELVNDWRREGSEWNPGKWIKWQLKWENATFWCRDVVPTCDIYRYGELTTMDKYGPVIKKKDKRERRRTWDLESCSLHKAHNNTESIFKLQKSSNVESSGKTKEASLLADTEQPIIFGQFVSGELLNGRNCFGVPVFIYLFLLIWFFHEWKTDRVHYNEMYLSVYAFILGKWKIHSFK